MQCSPRRTQSLFFTGCFLLISYSPAAIQIDGFLTEKNDRFANDADFIANDYDLSGVGINDSGRWLTMISPNVYIGAQHFKPAVNSSVTFYQTNDPSGPSVTRFVSATTKQIGADTDIFLGVLDQALPSGYQFYNFATEDISAAGINAFSSSTYTGADAFVLGRSPTNFTVSQDIAVGRNKLDVWWDSITAQTSPTVSNTGAAIGAVINSPEDDDYVQHEADLRIGDSGAPLFVASAPNQFTIVGINWFTSNPQGTFIGHSYLGNYDEEIQAFVDANPVPEPAYYSLLLGILALTNVVFSRKNCGYENRLPSQDNYQSRFDSVSR
jgi:hypothetical protein